MKVEQIFELNAVTNYHKDLLPLIIYELTWFTVKPKGKGKKKENLSIANGLPLLVNWITYQKRKKVHLF